jgi:hypothetical protein
MQSVAFSALALASASVLVYRDRLLRRQRKVEEEERAHRHDAIIARPSTAVAVISRNPAEVETFPVMHLHDFFGPQEVFLSPLVTRKWPRNPNLVPNGDLTLMTQVLSTYRAHLSRFAIDSPILSLAPAHHPIHLT